MNFATVTLTTDADLMRISKACGTLTGHTTGEDDAYYYLHSGDTVTLSSSTTTFGMTVESISSPDEEASFLVGVPDAAIQKVLIPQPGQPYPLKSLSLSFEAAKGEIRVIKTDAKDGTMLAGATFELVSNGAAIATATTGADGVATFSDVPAGTYTLREVSAPEGYVLSVPAEQTVTVASGQTSEAAFANRRSTAKIRIVKTDALTGAKLTGAEFTITDAAGEIVATLTTDANGVTETDWLRYGVYTVTETKVPEHYVDSGFSCEVTINEEDMCIYLVDCDNEPSKGYIQLTKSDRLNGDPISGVRFDVFYDDQYGEGLATTMVTDENGVAVSEPLRKGTYIVREHGETAGYVFETIGLNTTSKEEIAVIIDSDHRSPGKPVATVTNQRKQVRFIKVDTSGNALSGVAFSLINAVTHEVVETAVSNEQGEFIFTQFDYGDWIIRETAAPEGYSRMEDYLLHVDKNWTEPNPITLVNIPSTYLFYRCDNRRNPLAGVVFAVEDVSGNTVQEVTSAENGVVTVENLGPGKYTIQEIATVEGFTVSGDTITVVIDENYTVPTKFKRFVNYPSIATGVDVSPTMLTWVGICLVSAAGLVLVVRRKRK